MIYDTPENRAMAQAVAEQYNPKEGVLLVGSTMWLGEGRDIDVVVFVDDLYPETTGKFGGSVIDSEDDGWASYTHGEVNVIATNCPIQWKGWCMVAHIVPYLPRSLLESKAYRVAICTSIFDKVKEASQ